MSRRLYGFLVAVLFAIASPPATAGQDMQSYLDKFFSGAAFRYGYGAGDPRVELEIHYCPSGRYLSGGQSCLSGSRCSRIQDSGDWLVVAEDGHAQLRLVSALWGASVVDLTVDSNGVVMDASGNAFYRVSKALCQ